METKSKNKDQSTNHHKKYQECEKQQKSNSNGKYNIFHGPLSQKWIDERYQYLILYVMLTQVMSNLLSGFRFVLESIRNNSLTDSIE